MILRQVLSKSINGYWDGGPLSTFDWRIEHHHSGSEQSRVGSWGANVWFTVATGKSDKGTLGNAKRALRARAKAANVECTFEYVEE